MCPAEEAASYFLRNVIRWRYEGHEIEVGSQRAGAERVGAEPAPLGGSGDIWNWSSITARWRHLDDILAVAWQRHRNRVGAARVGAKRDGLVMGSVAGW